MNARKLARIAVKKGVIQKISEFSPLISFLKKRKLNTIVEIGTARAGTFYAWCKIAEPDAMIVSIDLPGGPFGVAIQLRILKGLESIKEKIRGYITLEKILKIGQQKKN
jgi:hypothetical protein